MSRGKRLPPCDKTKFDTSARAPATLLKPPPSRLSSSRVSPQPLYYAPVLCMYIRDAVSVHACVKLSRVESLAAKLHRRDGPVYPEKQLRVVITPVSSRPSAQARGCDNGTWVLTRTPPPQQPPYFIALALFLDFVTADTL